MNLPAGTIVFIGRDPNQKAVVDIETPSYVRVRPLNFTTDIYWFSKCGVFTWYE